MLDISYSFSGNLDGELRRVLEELQRPRPLMARLGNTLANDLRAHFLARDAEGNTKGWPRKHFWKKVVYDATRLTDVSDTGAEVTVASLEFAHKLTGGEIRPKNRKFLAIPISARAYKAGSPSLWEGPEKLFRLGGPKQPARDGSILAIMHKISETKAWVKKARHVGMAVGRAKFGSGKKAGKSYTGALYPMYVLKESVLQASDPRALPDQAVIERHLTEVAEAWLQRRLDALR